MIKLIKRLYRKLLRKIILYAYKNNVIILTHDTFISCYELQNVDNAEDFLKYSMNRMAMNMGQKMYDMGLIKVTRERDNKIMAERFRATVYIIK